jgi:hypothetical protein
MSDDTKVEKEVDLVVKTNRKQRRYEAKLERQAHKEYRDAYYWRRRIVNEMKENKQVQEKIIEGKFDYFLDLPDPTQDV